MASDLKFKSDFVINAQNNISNEYDKEVDQVPISFVVRGPSTIRKRSIAYICTIGTDPCKIVGGCTT